MTPPKALGGRTGRGGRPTADQAGDVDRRILDAATTLFLEQGFDRTNCGQVATLAGAGKASIYARYANKEELFAAVVRRNVKRTMEPSGRIETDGPLHDRLRAVGLSILHHSFQPDVVAMMRVVMATAHRMPELTRLTDRIGREQGVQRIAEAIAGCDDPEAVAQAHKVAAKFIDLVFLPHQMSALVGDSLDQLDADADRRVSEAIELLSGAGWLERWERDRST